MTTSSAPQLANAPSNANPRMSDSRELYEAAVAEFGPALIRLAQSYERDPDRRQDLLQDIHFALWRSFTSFDQRCSVRT